MQGQIIQEVNMPRLQFLFQIHYLKVVAMSVDQERKSGLLTFCIISLVRLWHF